MIDEVDAVLIIAYLKGSVVRLPDHSAGSEIKFASLYVRSGWFTGIELVLGLTTWVHFLSVQSLWAEDDMRTICHSSPRYSSFRRR